MSSCVVGLFVGGRSRRMGGRPKGRLTSPLSGEPILQHQARLCGERQLPCVVVGEAGEYADLVTDVMRLADSPAGVGPLGGLGALLAHAGEHPAIAIACDMPYLTAGLLRVLIEQPRGPMVVAPRDPVSGLWQPLFARYEPAAGRSLAAYLGRGERSFQGWFAELEVSALALDAEQFAQLRDWDAPEDMEP